MHIHLFGHSICRSKKIDGKPTETFVDLLEKQYHTSADNTFTVHQADCMSVERTLYFLKKSKPIDLAIIFYALGDSIFIPCHQHDAPISKVNMNNVTESTPYRYGGEIAYHRHVIEDRSKPDVEYISGDELDLAVKLYFKYLHTRDLNRNRFYGALYQIDQYLTKKNIPAVHCLEETFKYKNHPWFKFTSGVVNEDLSKLQNNGPYKTGHNQSANRINSEGNTYIANKLSEYVEQLITVPHS